MTIAAAVSCGVCATPLEAAVERCPSCGAPTSTAPAAPPSTLPTLLAGCASATAGPRGLAIGVDALVLLGLGAALLLGPGLLGDAGWAMPVLYVLLTVLALALTGRTLGGLVAGLRTVDLFTGLPLGPGRLLTPWRADGVTLDVRRGRDPLRATSSARPGSPAARAAVPPRSAGASWAPAPAAAPGAPRAGRSGPGPLAPSQLLQPVPQRTTTPQPTTQQPTTQQATPAQPTTAQASPARPTTAGLAPAQPTTAQAAGVLVTTADGGRFTITGTALLGRNPQPRDGERADTVVPVNDLQRTVSKTHAGLRWDGRSLWLTDRGSTNGTVVTDPTGNEERLAPWVEAAVAPGSTVQLGDQAMTVTFPSEGGAR